MRSSLLYALQGAVGALAYDSIVYKAGDSQHKEHDHVGEYNGGKKHYVPESSTFFSLHDGDKQNHWDHDSKSSPHDSTAKIYVDFKDDAVKVDNKPHHPHQGNYNHGSDSHKGDHSEADNGRHGEEHKGSKG